MSNTKDVSIVVNTILKASGSAEEPAVLSELHRLIQILQSFSTSLVQSSTDSANLSTGKVFQSLKACIYINFIRVFR